MESIKTCFISKFVSKIDKSRKNDRIAYMKRVLVIIVNFFVSIIIAFCFWEFNFLLLTWNNTIGYILFFVFNLLLVKIVTNRSFVSSILLVIPLLIAVVIILDWISDISGMLFLSLISSVIVYPIYTKKLLCLK